MMYNFFVLGTLVASGSKNLSLESLGFASPKSTHLQSTTDNLLIDNRDWGV